MKLNSVFLILLLISRSVFAFDYSTCDWTTITPEPNKTFIYPEALHLCVGQMQQDNITLTNQVSDLNKAITLKDLALTKADQRAQLWMDTSDKLTDRVTKIDQEVKHNEFIYFGLGVLATFGAAYAAGKLMR